MDYSHCMEKLETGNWKPQDVAIHFLLANVSPFSLIKLLQTHHGLSLWKALKQFRFTNRGASIWKRRNQTGCEATIVPNVLGFSICYTAGFTLFCGHHSHSLLTKIPWYCSSQEPMPRFAFERAEKHLRCYILLCGIKKFRNPPFLHGMDRFVVRMIARDVWNLQFHNLDDIERYEKAIERAEDIQDYIVLVLLFICLICLSYVYVF